MILLCGPCSAESFEQLYSTAEILQPFNIDYFRAGLWKPRTRPNGFEGVKEVGLAWMKQIKKDFQMKIVTEVANPYMVEKCLENDFDAIWIGARTTQNPFIVEDIATALEGTDIHILGIGNPAAPVRQFPVEMGPVQITDRLFHIRDIIAPVAQTGEAFQHHGRYHPGRLHSLEPAETAVGVATGHDFRQQVIRRVLPLVQRSGQ